MIDFNSTLKKIKKDIEKLQNDLEFFSQAYVMKCLEEEDRKEVKKDIREIRNDLNKITSSVNSIAIIHKR